MDEYINKLQAMKESNLSKKDRETIVNQMYYKLISTNYNKK